MSRNTSVPKDYIPGDEICKSCIGIAYLDKEMKKRNEHYTCFGIKRTLTRTVPMENLEKHDKREDNDSDKIVCIGYSQASNRMERTGKGPICMIGIQFNLNFSKQTNKTVVQKPKEEGGDEIIPHTDVPRNINSDMTKLNANVEWFQALMQRGMAKQWTAMGVFYKQTSDKFPEKCYRSVTGLGASTLKTYERMERGAGKLWGMFR